MKGLLGGLWLPKGIIRSTGNRLHPISVLGAGFVSLLIASKSRHTDSPISNRGSLLEKRGSVRVDSAQLFSLERCDSALPFPDWRMLLREIRRLGAFVIDENSWLIKIMNSGQ